MQGQGSGPNQCRGSAHRIVAPPAAGPPIRLGVGDGADQAHRVVVIAIPRQGEVGRQRLRPGPTLFSVLRYEALRGILLNQGQPALVQQGQPAAPLRMISRPPCRTGCARPALALGFMRACFGQ